MDKIIKRLQNLSDIRGIAMECRQDETIGLTPEVINLITLSFIKWLAHKISKSFENLYIAIGIDSRLSGPAIKKVVIDTLTDIGCNVLDCGITSTPALYMAIIHDSCRCNGAIMITASHLPCTHNGMKFFTIDGGIEIDDLNNIIQEINKPTFFDTSHKGTVIQLNIIDDYCGRIIEYIRDSVNDKEDFDHPLKELKVIVDAGNGVSGFFVEKILKPLGADTEGSLYLTPDGNFPNHLPNPENEEAIKELQQAVIDSKADLGIIFDADMDKASFVDRNGNLIVKNKLVALVASMVLEEHPNSTIVTDSTTSDWLTDFIHDELQGIHHRFKRGYRKVINEAKRLNNEHIECWVTVETSGHTSFKENDYVDDGAYLAAKVLIKSAKFKNLNRNILTDLIKNLHVAQVTKTFRLKLLNPDYESEASRVIMGIRKFSENVPGWKVWANTFEGTRISADRVFGDGWFICRLSLHEPVLVLYIESNSDHGMKMIISRLIKILVKYRNVDIALLNNAFV